jgi:hypothetical protein
MAETKRNIFRFPIPNLQGDTSTNSIPTKWKTFSPARQNSFSSSQNGPFPTNLPTANKPMQPPPCNKNPCPTNYNCYKIAAQQQQQQQQLIQQQIMAQHKQEGDQQSSCCQSKLQHHYKIDQTEQQIQQQEQPTNNACSTSQNNSNLYNFSNTQSISHNYNNLASGMETRAAEQQQMNQYNNNDDIYNQSNNNHKSSYNFDQTEQHQQQNSSSDPFDISISRFPIEKNISSLSQQSVKIGMFFYGKHTYTHTDTRPHLHT